MAGKLAKTAMDHLQITEQLSHRAQHDPLTGLPNRVLFEDRLHHALALARRNRKMLGLLVLDLDRFKSINDTLGHHAGDAVLQQFAQRAWEEGDVSRLVELLEQQRPKHGDEKDLRGFEWHYLWRLTHSELRAITVKCDVWRLSTDGHRLAHVSQNGIVRVLDVTTGSQVCALQNRVFQDSVGATYLNFSPDGKRLVSVVSDGLFDRHKPTEITVWDASTGQAIRTFKGAGWGREFFSPDGLSLCSLGMSSHEGIVWDIATGRKVASLTGLTDHPPGVVFSPDGRRLANGSRDGTIRLWDLSTGKELFVLKGHNHQISCLSFSPDGQHLASSAESGRPVKLWDLTTRKESLSLEGHMRVSYIVFSPEGRFLATISPDRRMKVWVEFPTKSGQRVKGFSVRTLPGRHTPATSGGAGCCRRLRCTRRPPHGPPRGWRSQRPGPALSSEKQRSSP